MLRTIEDIRKSEERLARIVALSADAIICVDGEQRITMFNEGAERSFGFTAAEMIGQSLARLIPQRFHAAHTSHVRSFASGQPVSRHMGERQAVFALRKSGEEFPADASISKIIVGGEAVYTVVLRDVSERVAREQERRIEGERFRQAVDAGRLGAFEHDLSTGQLRLLGHAAVIFGVSEVEIAFEIWMALVDPQDVPTVTSHMRRVIETGRQVETEYRINREDGGQRWIRGIASLGGETRIFGTIQDITEQKAQQFLLEERVAERTAALEAEILRREQAQEALVRVQRMEAYGQLTGGIAHDFNNLLTVIGGNLELLDDHSFDERQARLLKRAIDAVGMGSRLTYRLLSFARRGRLEPQMLNLNEQVLGVIDLLRRTIGETIMISSDLSPDLGQVRADASEIENAILNLAINARDAMPDGGRLMIETSNIDVEAASAQPGGIDGLQPGAFVRLSVSDTGTGMSREVLARAFEPFFTTKEPGRGTGLGLASIYGFVHQSNGSVAIQSEVGRGTSVSIYLPKLDSGPASLKPAAKDAAGAEESAGEEAKAHAGQAVILVVEDNADVRDIASARLERLGYRVRACGDGPSAIALLESGLVVNLVFSDIMMSGGISGYDLGRWVAANRPGLGVLLTSGFSDGADHRDTSLKILRKPYSNPELARAIAAALA
jgi:PAS domain S-box-containing protein